MVLHMADRASETSPPPKRRKPRPSRGRGLRTNTGCLTCRQRRLKCDEDKPNCGQCVKSSRNCVYSEDQVEPSHSSLTASSPTTQQQAGQWIQPGSPPSEPQFGHRRRTSSDPHAAQPPNTGVGSTNTSFHQPSLSFSNSNAGITSPNQPPSELSFSPVTQNSSFTPGTAPYEWYDLLARDAWKNVDNYDFLTNSGSRWSFEPGRFSRNIPQSNPQFTHRRLPSIDRSPSFSRPAPITDTESASYPQPALEPWNSSEPTNLGDSEMKYFQFFIDIVGPIMDLFDSLKHFTNLVPHLALRNVGLLKSMLAVSARYKGCLTAGKMLSTVPHSSSPVTPSSQTLQDEDMGVQYYYETLSYLSQAMQYPSYARSTEIVATAVLISCYEGVASESSMDWERHLKGVFWIQRSQDNDGERRGLAGAVWWHWLRQDIWAALRQRRKTLTIWKPKKTMNSLTQEELACRILYLQAKAVSYASDEARETQELGQRIEEGDMLLRNLQEWYNLLPEPFKPLPSGKNVRKKTTFPPVWIHPPMYAAAMQAYSSAKILILLNKPSVGGVSAYHDSQKMLDEAVSMICGIAQAPNASEIPSALVNVQALSIAGQCVRTREQQEAIAELLNRTLDVTKFPSKSTIDDLRNVWSGNS